MDLREDWKIYNIPKCPRLLVGQGNDTYDPECSLPLGHKGVCKP